VNRDTVANVLIARVIVREGGVGDANDGKGITRWGQTSDWLDDFGLPVPQNATDAARNYRLWLDKTGLIDVCAEPDALADAVIDFAVNSGHVQAVKVLQRALRVTSDGVLGPKTTAALAACDRAVMAKRVLAGRIQFLGEIITAKPQKHARQAKGWMRRLAAQIEDLP
jgi:lysozyme family protein